MHDVLTKELLGDMVKAHREELGLSQDKLVKEIGKGINRSQIAHLEQALRIPSPDILEAICGKLNIPKRYWLPFTKDQSLKRFEFESLLTELVGIPASLKNSDDATIAVVERLIAELFNTNYSSEQAYHSLLRVFVFYDIPAMSQSFFEKYITPDAFKSLSAFEQKLKAYQKDAIRLYSSFEDAYISLNNCNDIDQVLSH